LPLKSELLALVLHGFQILNTLKTLFHKRKQLIFSKHKKPLPFPRQRLGARTSPSLSKLQVNGDF
jgi:hypothetical protein